MGIVADIVHRRDSRTSKPNVLPLSGDDGTIDGDFIPASAPVQQIYSPDGTKKFTLGDDGNTQVEEV